LTGDFGGASDFIFSLVIRVMAVNEFSFIAVIPPGETVAMDPSGRPIVIPDQPGGNTISTPTLSSTYFPLISLGIWPNALDNVKEIKSTEIVNENKVVYLFNNKQNNQRYKNISE
jgi:hypothetical protein